MKEPKYRKSAYSKFDDERSVAMSILPKVEGALKRKRFLMILLYIGYIALWGVALAIFPGVAVYLATFSVVTLLMVIFFTWRYVKIEYELTIHMVKLEFAVIYGGMSRRELFSCMIRDLKVIAPYDEKGRSDAESYDATETKIFVSDIDSVDNYYATYESEDGEKILLVL